MKSPTPLPTQFAGSLTGPLPIPVTNVARPVRQGSFWPGESFSAGTNKWDLTGAFAGQAFILSGLSGSKGSRTL